MQYKFRDVDVDSISYEDEVGDTVLYPNEYDSPEYTIAIIDEDDDGNVMYTLIAEEDGAVSRVPFEDCLHIESHLVLCRHQLKTYDKLYGVIDEAQKFVGRHG